MEKLELKNNGVVWKRLPPGFRFHPTDEELVVQYLWRKVLSFPLPSSIIPEVDLNNHDPSNLPGWIERENEGYFFNLREAKYKRSNNIGRSGYWKAIGKEMPITSSRSNRLVGMKKVLIFFRGSNRTKWIMHEFRLAGVAGGVKSCMFHAQRENLMNPDKEWVVCRIFKKARNKKIHAKKIIDSMDSLMQVNKVSKLSSSSSSSSSSSLSLSCVTEISEDSSNEEEYSSKNIVSYPHGSHQD